jgi:hypothetical protein
MSKDPPDLGIDLRIIQFCGEGMIGTTWPWIYPQSYLLLAELLDTAVDKGLQEVRAHQPTLYQSLDDLMQGL